METVIVDYGSGNLRSAAKAFERMARDVPGPEMKIVVSADPERILAADRVVLPGVGAFADCAAGIRKIDGLWEGLDAYVNETARPFLGICVGMQLMATHGEEHGNHTGFGWIPGRVVAIEPNDPGLKVPHMGWNRLDADGGHALLDGISRGAYAYFVHSYHLLPDDPGHCLAHVEYGGRLTAMVARDNLAGTQFHPEKSQAAGLRLISNFLKWTP